MASFSRRLMVSTSRLSARGSASSSGLVLHSMELMMFTTSKLEIFDCSMFSWQPRSWTNWSKNIRDSVRPKALPCSTKIFRRDARTGADMCRNTWL